MTKILKERQNNKTTKQQNNYKRQKQQQQQQKKKKKKDKSVIQKINTMRVTTDDFKIVKILGRGAFGEVIII